MEVASDMGSSDVCNTTQCDVLRKYIRQESRSWSCGQVDVSIGMPSEDVSDGEPSGRCCHEKTRWWWRLPARSLASASKMISGYTALKLIDEGLFSLDTRVGDVLEWWDAHGDEKRRKITVRHLMSMTSGIVPPEKPAPNACDSPEDTSACSFISRSGSQDNEPGNVWRYSQVDLAVVGEIAQNRTNLTSWDAIFRKYIGAPLGVDADKCYFWNPLGQEVFEVAGGMRCTIDEFSKILQAISAKLLVTDSSLWDETERPHTLGLPMIGDVGANICTNESIALGCRNGFMPDYGNYQEGVYWHYGLMQWIECASPNCQEGTVRISSPGLFGTYPWVDRGLLSGARPHWGVVYRQTTGFCSEVYGVVNVTNHIVIAE